METIGILIIFVFIIIIIIRLAVSKEKSSRDPLFTDNVVNSYVDKIKQLEGQIDSLKSALNKPQSTVMSTGDINKIADKIADNKYQKWIEQHEEKIRNDSKVRQRGKIISSIDQQMMPLLGIGFFPGKFYEARFIGNPITYIVFKNLENPKLDLEIVFVEISNNNIMKSGRVRKAIAEGKVSYSIINKSD